jgi:hypothetical protein
MRENFFMVGSLLREIATHLTNATRRRKCDEEEEEEGGGSFRGFPPTTWGAEVFTTYRDSPLNPVTESIRRVLSHAKRTDGFSWKHRLGKGNLF